MKRVLVPTDFSPNALTAARYAAFLSESRNWQVEIYHFYLPFYSGFQSEVQNQKDKEQARNNAESNMNNFIRQLQHAYPNVRMQGHCLIGNVAEEIVAEAQKPDVVFIVMGTEGAKGLKYKLLGSTTFSVVQKATIPVMAIPKNTKRFSLQKVGFTTNFHAVEITALHDFIELMEQPVEIIPFHLFDAGRLQEEVKLKSWKSKVDKMIAPHPPKISLVRMRSHTAGIRSFIKKEKLDVLVMTRIEKGFFDKLLGRNLIKAVVHQCTTPVLFIPEG